MELSLKEANESITEKDDKYDHLTKEFGFAQQTIDALSTEQTNLRNDVTVWRVHVLI